MLLPPCRLPEQRVLSFVPLQWRLLLQTMGKAGKGTAWAEYKLESVLTVPSLISESVIMEDDDEGSTPGSTPAKGSPRPVADEEWQEDVRRMGREMNLLGTVRRVLTLLCREPHPPTAHGMRDGGDNLIALMSRWAREMTNRPRGQRPHRLRPRSKSRW